MNLFLSVIGEDGRMLQSEDGSSRRVLLFDNLIEFLFCILELLIRRSARLVDSSLLLIQS